MTTRDDVWSEVLEHLASDGAFRRFDLPFESEQRHTARRTLREMEAHGWLSRTSKHSPIWRAGPKAQAHLDIDEGAEVAVESDEDG